MVKTEGDKEVTGETITAEIGNSGSAVTMNDDLDVNSNNVSNITTLGATTGNITTVSSTTVGATTGNITTVNATTVNSGTITNSGGTIEITDIVDMNQNQIQQIVVENIAGDAGSPVAGQMWLNTSTSTFKAYDGSTTQEVGAAVGTVPIGGIVAWMKSITGVPALPDTFVECNGGTVSDGDSPINGQTIPTLNSGTNRMLRGHTASGATGGADTHTLTEAEMPAHTHSDKYAGSWSGAANGSISFMEPPVDTNTTSSTGGSGAHNNLPGYTEVVWIMRIK